MKLKIIAVIFAIIAISCLCTAVYNMALYKQSKLVERKTQFINTTLDSLKKEIYREMERAYFEGQKDAINGDIRIAKTDSCYVWIKSPWDGGKQPTFVLPCGDSTSKKKLTP